MPGPNTTIEMKGIASVLSSTRLEVPLHQRVFTWTEEVQELLEDVGEAFNRKREDYFLGSLVIIAAREGGRPNVLDGQQRLAVISLLLAGIADQFHDRGDERRSQEVRSQYLTTFDIREGTERPQLKLNHIDDAYFRSILMRGATEPEHGATDSHRRLWEARQSISNWLSNKLDKISDSINWLAEFTEYLTHSAYVIYFTVPDDANAFLIFETMNDRGLDLSIADLLKNYLLGRAGEDTQTVLGQWTTAIASLGAYGGENLFKVFLRHFWSSKYGLVREKELYRNMKLRIATSANVMDFADELAHNSYFYAAILSPEHEFWSEASLRTRERIRTLSLLGLEQYRPMLLSALAHLQPGELENLLRLVIGWNVRLLIVGGLGGGAMENHYCELGKAIRNGELKSVKEIANRAKSFIPNDTIFRDSFASAYISKAYLARYYLRTLERQASGEPQPELVPNADPAELNLEHVLPERPAEDSWHQFNEDDRRAYTKRLGNMLLLKEKMNSKLRNGPFDDKREVYKSSDLLLTKKVAEFDGWNKATIDERQNYLADLAVKAWSIKP
ncbi:MAG: DUF262 domain-containing protein [Dehalococcoidia bacterium]|nr:DUF262 domain-containing protein [Dehalococcoidia bacterium]